ncbi:MAG: glutaredoxin domain-containing protein [Gammaproteobacteria bacterium]|jgi:glutaredoxin 3|nr:glutaredoxin domain-containing protein [Gammaproteobacteria bacterium]
MANVTVYTKNLCSFCSAAKQLLKSKNFPFDEVNMEGDQELMIKIMKQSGQRTVPQIFVGDVSVGGYRELTAAMASGEFAELVANT